MGTRRPRNHYIPLTELFGGNDWTLEVSREAGKFKLQLAKFIAPSDKPYSPEGVQHCTERMFPDTPAKEAVRYGRIGGNEDDPYKIAIASRLIEYFMRNRPDGQNSRVKLRIAEGATEPLHGELPAGESEADARREAVTALAQFLSTAGVSARNTVAYSDPYSPYHSDNIGNEQRVAEVLEAIKLMEPAMQGHRTRICQATEAARGR